jgi:hypothetical protein
MHVAFARREDALRIDQMTNAETKGLPKSRPRMYAGLIAILCVAFALRVWGLGEWWLNPDEGIYYSILTRADFGGFWAELMANAHPPLYYVLLRILGLFTWDFLAFRFVSVLCGLGAVVGAWAVGRELGGRGSGGEAAGFISALLVALSPSAIGLSQVIRPYMLQLALLSGALYLLLRYQRAPTTRTLAWYVAFVLLALLTHYSSVLALGVFVLLVVYDGFEGGFGRPEWRRLALSHVVPVAVIGLLYLFHLRRLSTSPLADQALNGWLSFYMVDSPATAWLGFLGYQWLVVPDWARAPAALLLLSACVLAIVRSDARPAVIGVGALAAGVGAAAVHAYPFGATRHDVWLMAFTVPVLGWLGAWTVRMSRSRAVLSTGSFAAVLAIGAPLGSALGADDAPWAPSEQVLSRRNVTRMVNLLDPRAEPGLVVMSSQTFYLLLPFYPAERELAVFAQDSSIFHFPYGARQILVSGSWDFTAGPDVGAEDHLVGTLVRADAAFPDLSIGQRDEAALLVGGWRPPLIDELHSLSGPEPAVLDAPYVPGLFAFLLDLPALRRAFEP